MPSRIGLKEGGHRLCSFMRSTEPMLQRTIVNRILMMAPPGADAVAIYMYLAIVHRRHMHGVCPDGEKLCREAHHATVAPRCKISSPWPRAAKLVLCYPTSCEPLVLAQILH